MAHVCPGGNKACRFDPRSIPGWARLTRKTQEEIATSMHEDGLPEMRIGVMWPFNGPALTLEGWLSDKLVAAGTFDPQNVWDIGIDGYDRLFITELLDTGVSAVHVLSRRQLWLIDNRKPWDVPLVHLLNVVATRLAFAGHNVHVMASTPRTEELLCNFPPLVNVEHGLYAYVAQEGYYPGARFRTTVTRAGMSPRRAVHEAS